MSTPTPKSQVAELTESATIVGEVFDADAFFAEFKAKARPFRLGGQVFHLPAPETWPDSLDEAKELLDVSTAILGDRDEAIRYREAGGSVKFLQALVQKLHGLTLGESVASSSS